VRYGWALLASLLASGAMFFVSAIVLAIANIYLAGHGIDWPNQEITPGMSPLSYAMMAAVFATFGAVFAGTLWITSSARSPPGRRSAHDPR